MPRGVKRKRGRSVSRRTKRVKRHHASPYRRLSRNFARSKTVVMRYASNFDLTATAPSIDGWKWRANSIFDPDESIGGHQPLGHDEYALQYKYYKVLKSRLTVYFTSASTGVTGQMMCGIKLGEASYTLPTTHFEMVEHQRGEPAWILPINSGGSIKKVVKYFDSRKEFQASDTNINTGALFSANPLKQAYFYPWIGPVDASTSSVCVCFMHCEYVVKMWEPLAQPTS